MAETLDSMKKQVIFEAEAILTLENAYQKIKYAISIEEQFRVVAQLKGILEGGVQITQTHYRAQELHKYFAQKKLSTQEALFIVGELERIVKKEYSLSEFH